MEPPIPDDAAEAAKLVVQALEAQLKPLLEELPEAPDSAIQFRVTEAE